MRNYEHVHESGGFPVCAVTWSDELQVARALLVVEFEMIDFASGSREDHRMTTQKVGSPGEHPLTDSLNIVLCIH
jgi:hypothetical protein